jgi:hypothetical protein
MDVSAEDNPDQEKLRYAWYDTLEDAKAQAEWEMGHKDAEKRHREHYHAPDFVLHPSGIKIIGVEDKDGKTVWKPRKK